MNKIDELKAEIEKAERGLKNKREEFARLTEIREGDYVEATTCDGVIIGRLEAMGSDCFDGTVYKVKTWSDKKIFILKSIKKWQPKRGDLCIFGDFGDDGNAVIGVFLEENNDNYPDCPVISITGVYDYCIPFISAEQFKEHIGYE